MTSLAFPASAALWFLPFVLPLCAATMLSDLRSMRIPNWIVDSLVAVYVLVGIVAMPDWAAYGWHLLHLPVGLLIGFLIYSAGLVGAGDAKFAAAAAPFVAFGDLAPLLVLFCALLLTSVASHRIARHSPLRRLAPNWQSWQAGRKFPMGLCLGATLALYLVAAALGTAS